MPQLNALKSYEKSGNLNFDQKVIRLREHIDSVLQNLNENTKKFRAVKKKLDPI